MKWVYWAIAAASAVHVAEEHAYPGGSLGDANEQLARRFGPRMPPALSVVLAR